MADPRADTRRQPSPRRVGGIRIRTTVAAVVVVGVGMLIASLVMLNYVARSLTAQVGDEAELRARELTRDPASIADGVTVPVGEPKEAFVQVLAGDAVVASSENVSGEPPLVLLRAGRQASLDAVPFTPGPFVVDAVGATTPEGERLVMVGLNIDDVVEARHAVAVALLIGGPLLLLVVGLVTWWIVGRTLRPVEDMRIEVERISSRELHRRVPVPAADDEISRLGSTMNQMLDRLDAAQRRERRFVSDASHELRSPTASIRQHAEVAREHPDRTSVGELAEVVLQEDERLQRLVEDLLLLAQLDETGPDPSVEVDLDDLVLAEGARLRAISGLEVDMVGVSGGRVMGNRSHLQRMVRNLVDNAAHHARERAALGLESRDGQVVLTVEDDGPGIRAEDRQVVFDRFVRLDDARARGTGGTGLGLAIVREVATSHGARVDLADGALGGLLVQVRFPSVDREEALREGKQGVQSRDRGHRVVQ